MRYTERQWDTQNAGIYKRIEEKINNDILLVVRSIEKYKKNGNERRRKRGKRERLLRKRKEAGMKTKRD